MLLLSRRGREPSKAGTPEGGTDGQPTTGQKASNLHQKRGATSGARPANDGEHCSAGPDTICDKGWRVRSGRRERQEPSISRAQAAFSGSRTSNVSGIDNELERGTVVNK